MRATIKEAERLAKALAFLAKVPPKRSPHPILSNLWVEVRENVLLLMATDLDIMCRAYVEIADGEPGVCTVPAVRLAKLVAELPGDARLTLRLANDGRVLITCNRGNWRLPTLPNEDFPQLTMPADNAAQFVLPADTAQILVQRLGYAISNEETRYYLNGLSLRRQAGKLVCASANGHVLVELTLDIDPGRDLDAIVPTRMIEALKTLAHFGDVDVSVNGNKISFAHGPWLALGKLIDGTFPDYQRIIPIASDNRVEINAEDLLASIARLKSVADVDKAIGLRWSSDAPLLQTCLSRDEDNVEDIDAKVSGTARVAASADYLIHTVEAFGIKSAVCIDHSADAAPIRVTAVTDGAGPASSVAVIMPMTWSKPIIDVQPIRATRGK